MVVQRNRKSPSTVLTAHNSTGNRTSMCNNGISWKLEGSFVGSFQAYKAGLYGPKVVWIFASWFGVNFWRENLDGVPCTAGEMDAAAEGAFVMGFHFRNPVEERGVAGITGRYIRMWSLFWLPNITNGKDVTNDNM